MSRYFAEIPIADFKDKLFQALKKHEDWGEIEIETQDSGEVSRKSPEDFDELTTETKIGSNTYKNFNFYALRAFYSLTPTIMKDIKVEFSLENVMGPEDMNRPGDPPHGVHKLPNGMVFFGMSAGGDWEHPVFVVIYWDGKKLRAYIPTEGNMWNTDTKMAYGNDEDDDKANILKRWPNTKVHEDYAEAPGFNWKEMKADIESRILPIQNEKPNTKSRPAYPQDDKDISNWTKEQKLTKMNIILSQTLSAVKNDLTNFMDEESERIVSYIDAALERAKKYAK